MFITPLLFPLSQAFIRLGLMHTVGNAYTVISHVSCVADQPNSLSKSYVILCVVAVLSLGVKSAVVSLCFTTLLLHEPVPLMPVGVSVAVISSAVLTSIQNSWSTEDILAVGTA